MKYCVNCGAKLEDEAKFCFKCGTASMAETLNTAEEYSAEEAEEVKADASAACDESEEAKNEEIDTETAIVSEVIDKTEETPVYVETVQTAKKTKYPAKTIVGFILSIVGIANGGIGAITAFLALFPYLSIMCMICAICYGAIGLGCSIAALILCRKVYNAENDNRKAKIGKTLSLVGIIAGGFGIVFGIVFGLIGMTFLASQLINTYGGFGFGR